MQNKNVLKWLNPILGLALITQALSLLLMDLVPSAILVHQVGGVLLLGLAAVHLFFNRAWVRSTYLAKPKG